MCKERGSIKEKRRRTHNPSLRISIILQKEHQVLRRTRTRSLKRPSALTTREEIIQRIFV